MPYSSDIFDSTVVSLIKYLRPKRVLDVGAGAGKYGSMIRELYPDTYLIGIEVESSYISKFNLHSVYDVIRCEDASCVITESLVDAFDLVIFGDVIEHLRKSVGLDLLNFLAYRSGFILLVYPVRYLQDDVEGYRSEAHISVWGETDFVGFDHSAVVQRDTQQLVVIQGYLPSKRKLAQIDRLLRRSNSSKGRT